MDKTVPFGSDVIATVQIVPPSHIFAVFLTRPFQQFKYIAMIRHLIFVIMGSSLFNAGCISTPSEADECFAIEAARCEMRGRCKLSFDVEGCKYYYEEQCRVRGIDEEYTDEQLNACVDSIDLVNPNGDVPAECSFLETAKFESELCLFEQFIPCQAFLCPPEQQDTSADTGADTATETDIPTGLNP